MMTNYNLKIRSSKQVIKYQLKNRFSYLIIMKMKSPLVIFYSSEQQRIITIQEKVTEYYSSTACLKVDYDESSKIYFLGLICQAKLLGLDFLNYFQQKNVKILFSKKGFAKTPKIMSRETFENLCFTEGEHRKIVLQASELPQDLVAPQYILAAKQQVQLDEYVGQLSKVEHQKAFQTRTSTTQKNLLTLSVLFSSKLIPNQQINLKIKNCLQEFDINGIKENPKFIPFDDYLKLAFQKSDLLEIEKYENSLSSILSSEWSAKIPPTLIILAKDRQCASTIYELMVSEGNKLLQKLIETDSQTFIAAYFDIKEVNYNKFWDFIPVSCKRYVNTTQSFHPPKFANKDQFASLLFTQLEVDQFNQSKNKEIIMDGSDIVHPRVIMCFLKQEAINYQDFLVSKFNEQRVIAKTYHSQVGCSFVGVLFDDHQINVNTIKSTIPKGVQYTFSKKPLQMCPDFVPVGVFRRLTFPSNLWIENLCQQQSQTKDHSKQELFSKSVLTLEHEGQVKKDPTIRVVTLEEILILDTIIIADFEAYYYNSQDQYPSEFAAIRIQNQQVVARMHCFIAADKEKFFKITDAKVIEKIFEIETLTRIVCPFNPDYTEEGKISDLLQLGQIFKQFCFASDQVLLSLSASNVQIEVLSQFDQVDSYNIAAKGINLENLVFKYLFQLNCQVLEITDLISKMFGFSKTYINKRFYSSLHNKERIYDYCLYHSKFLGQTNISNGETAHCALDDVMFLAKIFVTIFHNDTNQQFNVRNKLQVEQLGEEQVQLPQYLEIRQNVELLKTKLIIPDHERVYLNLKGPNLLISTQKGNEDRMNLFLEEVYELYQLTYSVSFKDPGVIQIGIYTQDYQLSDFKGLLQTDFLYSFDRCGFKSPPAFIGIETFQDLCILDD